MILTEIIGGLGNQMFQYAAGSALASRSGVALRYDDAGFGAYDLRRFALTDLCISGRRASLAEHVAVSAEGRVIAEVASAFEPVLLESHRCAYLKGYWQSERYFADIRPRLLSEFVPANDVGGPNRATIARMRDTMSISLHVRRGDYVTNSHTNAFHGVLPLEYYKAALQHIYSEQSGAGEESFMHFIFSDDPDWCEEAFSFLSRKEVVRNNSTDQAVLDIHLMRHCRHHIIANSSFSWWGAWLNEDPSQIVVAPRRWFLSTSVDSSSIVPERWRQI